MGDSRMKNLLVKWNQVSLVKRIIIGIIVGIILALIVPSGASWISIFGSLFVGALKAVAPILVLFIVMHAIAVHKSGKKTNMKSILGLYAIGTLLAGAVAVVASFLFPITLTLTTGAEDLTPPEGIAEVIETLLFNLVANPIDAVVNANYLGILMWAVVLGLALKNANQSTKDMLGNFSDAITKIVRWVINLAPLGIMGLVFDAIVTSGLSSLLDYGRLILILVGCMLFIALVVNPLIVFIYTRKNPYPIVLMVLRESGITAFFTRSSATDFLVQIHL